MLCCLIVFPVAGWHGCLQRLHPAGVLHLPHPEVPLFRNSCIWPAAGLVLGGEGGPASTRELGACVVLAPSILLCSRLHVRQATDDAIALVCAYAHVTLCILLAAVVAAPLQVSLATSICGPRAG